MMSSIYSSRYDHAAVSGRKPPPLARQTAKVTELAETRRRREELGLSAESNTLYRIQKCLALGNDPGIPESLAQTAFRQASRLMAEHNVTQAEVLAASSAADDKLRMAGQSTVAITSTKEGGAKVIQQTWACDVADAMETLFDCKSYTVSKNTSLEWVFYGIATNASAAASGFEMAHNLISEWTRYKTGVKHSYSLGCAAGLRSVAIKEKRKETELAAEQERRHHESEVRSKQSTLR